MQDAAQAQEADWSQRAIKTMVAGVIMIACHRCRQASDGNLPSRTRWLIELDWRLADHCRGSSVSTSASQPHA